MNKIPYKNRVEFSTFSTYRTSRSCNVSSSGLNFEIQKKKSKVLPLIHFVEKKLSIFWICREQFSETIEDNIITFKVWHLFRKSWFWLYSFHDVEFRKFFWTSVLNEEFSIQKSSSILILTKWQKLETVKYLIFKLKFKISKVFLLILFGEKKTFQFFWIRRRSSIFTTDWKHDYH